MCCTSLWTKVICLETAANGASFRFRKGRRFRVQWLAQHHASIATILTSETFHLVSQFKSD